MFSFRKAKGRDIYLYFKTRHLTIKYKGAGIRIPTLRSALLNLVFSMRLLHLFDSPVIV